MIVSKDKNTADERMIVFLLNLFFINNPNIITITYTKRLAKYVLVIDCKIHKQLSKANGIREYCL